MSPPTLQQQASRGLGIGLHWWLTAAPTPEGDLQQRGGLRHAASWRPSRRLQPRPRWYHQYQRLVTLIDVMMDTCTQATYDAMKWKINPAEFIHVVCVKEGASPPAPGEAGDGHLRELLRDNSTSSNDPPVMEDAPETPAPAQPARTGRRKSAAS